MTLLIKLLAIYRVERKFSAEKLANAITVLCTSERDYRLTD